jgi:hypothetical protein
VPSATTTIPTPRGVTEGTRRLPIAAVRFGRRGVQAGVAASRATAQHAPRSTATPASCLMPVSWCDGSLSCSLMRCQYHSARSLAGARMPTTAALLAAVARAVHQAADRRAGGRGLRRPGCARCLLLPCPYATPAT